MHNTSSQKTKVLFSEQLLTLYALSFLFGTGLGLFNPLMSTFMKQQEIGQIWIGLTSTIYFLTIALATPIITQLLQQLGIRRILLLGLSLMGGSAALFPWTSQLSLWLIIRILMGIGVCGILVAGQTALNYFSHESNRASVSGLYFMFMGLGFIIGPAIGPQFYKISPQLSFLLGGIVIFLAVGLISLFFREKVTISATSGNLSLSLLKKFKYPIHGIFVYGMAEATLITLYPVFLLNQNYTVEQMGFTLSIFVVGSLLSTVPVTNLADRFGKVKVLSICIIIGLINSIGLILLNNYQLILLDSWLAGASLGPVYPICLALVGEQVSRKELGSGTALFTTSYCLGTASGPVLAALMMELFGNRFIFVAFIPLFLWLLLRIGGLDKTKKTC